MISKEMETRIDQFIADNRQNLLQDVATLVNIKSVSVANDNPQAPYGEGCRKVLDKALQICEGMGFATKTMITMQAPLYTATQKKRLLCWHIWTLYRRATVGAMTHTI